MLISLVTIEPKLIISLSSLIISSLLIAANAEVYIGKFANSLHPSINFPESRQAETMFSYLDSDYNGEFLFQYNPKFCYNF